MFIKRIPNIEKLGPTLTKSCEANFIDISLAFFSHSILLEYENKLEEKLARRKRYEDNPSPERQARRQRYEDNPSPERQAKREKYKDNPSPVRQARRQRYEDNPSPERQARRKRYEDNPSPEKQARRERYHNDTGSLEDGFSRFVASGRYGPSYPCVV